MSKKLFFLPVEYNFGSINGITQHPDVSTIQGGSDKSGIFFFLLSNDTAQLKIIRFYKTKKQLTEVHIENRDIK